MESHRSRRLPVDEPARFSADCFRHVILASSRRSSTARTCAKEWRENRSDDVVCVREAPVTLHAELRRAVTQGSAPDERKRYCKGRVGHPSPVTEDAARFIARAGSEPGRLAPAIFRQPPICADRRPLTAVRRLTAWCSFRSVRRPRTSRMRAARRSTCRPARLRWCRSPCCRRYRAGSRSSMSSGRSRT